MKYMVVNEQATEEYECIIQLEERVNKLLEKGWKPQGGISIAVYSSKSGYPSRLYYAAQAMVKED